MVVRELVALFGFKVDKGQESKVSGSLDKLKKAAIAAAAAFVTGKLAQGVNQLVNDTAQLGDTIAKTSKQIGVNAQALQELQFAANIAGASNQDVTTGLRVLQKNMLEAADGTKSYVDDFKKLGVSVKDGNGRLKSAEELLPELADGFQNLATDTERTALAQTLMGRSGTKLVPLLNEGTDAINAQRMRAQELGGVLDTELLGLSEELIDAQTEQRAAFQGIRNTIAKILIPIWIEFFDRARDVAVELRGPVVRAVKVIVSVFRALGNILLTIAKGWLLVNDALVEIADSFFGVNRALTQTIIVLGVLVALLGLPVVLLGLIGAAIFVVIDDLNAMGEGTESVIGGMISEFQRLEEETGSVGGAIKEMLITAIAFWLDTSEEDIRQWIKDTQELLGNLIPIVIEQWEKRIAKFFSGLAGRFVRLAGMVADIFSDDETNRQIARGVTALGGAGGGVTGPVVSAPAGAGAGGANVTMGGNEVNITVNGGSGTPEQVGDAVAAKVREATERLNRQTMQQLTTAGAGGVL
jgi:hypothetical protein